MALGLLCLSLLLGVMPFLLVYFFCNDFGCTTILWMFGIFMTGLSIVTISISCVSCMTYKCVRYEKEEVVPTIINNDEDIVYF